ncbi:MAG TPA: VCBS repeat-containing protein [Hanamia sp.]|nr:VCBS repeat-containing protein [Hanamia sp.]
MINYKGIPYLLLLFVYVFLFCAGCRHKPSVPPLFIVKEAKSTGLDFSNTLTPTQQMNALKYMYYYNGAGVGAGDFNNDGKIDLFFASNQGDNKMYLNEGNLHFKDVTKEAKIPEDGGWSTGVSVVDINNDGLLDIYICRVGNFGPLHSKNQLLICQGIDKNGVPYYKDEAHKYGLDFSGFCTQAVFFDYDGDGDLDMFLLNHTIFENGVVGARSMLLKKEVPVAGDRIYRNDGNGHFTDVTKETGINSSVLDFGLGVTVSDINMDGYPDIYVGNDFHENDYLYINQHNGTFKEELTDHIMHTSKYTMGVDIADANNDGYPDIMSLDMLSPDPDILKRTHIDDDEDLFDLKLRLGYYYQYPRNNLQFNRRNGMFSEIGLYAGVAATDWSWSPLWMDFDNDGLKDLFISNGIPRRLNDIDYINFVSNNEIQQELQTGNIDKKDLEVINKFPQTKIYNKFYRNTGNMQFQDMGNEIGNDKKTFSNGAVYADFDNDGDLDVVVNNIDDPALLYENMTNDKNNGKKNKDFVEIKLRGSDKNINALGAKIILYCNGGIRTYEKYPVRGFMSSMETPIHIGLDKTIIDSAFLIWPDNTYQQIVLKPLDHLITFDYKKGLPKFDYRHITGYWKNPTYPMEDITSKVNLKYKHVENNFQEFNMEPLIPHLVSTEGPALAVADINHDGLEDVFIGSSKGKKNAVFVQQSNGKFFKSTQPALDNDSMYEDVSACFADVNNDGNKDLIIASGGDESYGKNVLLTPRVYLNDGKGHFSKLNDAFDSLFVNASCVVPYDFNGDGKIDLFIGGRSVPGNYGQIPKSYLLQNDGSGHFKDVTDKVAKGLSGIGFVTNAVWVDLNKDGEKDLVLSLEWGGIIAFINHHGTFTKKILTDKKGWWNFILPVDINNDGNIDLIAGNLGLNTRLKASQKEPVRLYYNDFDDNGTKEQVLTYYVDGREIPFATIADLEKQIPTLKKRFSSAADFAKASLDDIFTKEKLENSEILTENYYQSSVLINKGNLNFTVQPLPWQAQLSSYRDAVVVDANGDNLPDILLVGNYYGNNVQMGRSDADFGTILLNKGNGQFTAESINGLEIKGQVRHIKKINIGKKEAYILARNNDSTMVIDFK